MHLWRTWLVLGLCAAFAARAVVVYKWTDADGVVHFSDQAVPGAERIVVSSNASNGVTSGLSTPSTAQSEKKSSGAPMHFDVLTIDSPAKDQVFQSGEVVPVHLQIEPGPKSNQEVSWLLNGQPTDQGGGASSFSLSGLARGSYTLSAKVTDQLTGNSQASDSVTFTIHQTSIFSPQSPLNPRNRRP